MRSPNYFVVSPDGGTYANTKNFGDSELIMSSNIEEHTYVNRVAIVRSVPEWYDGVIAKDDKVIVHHNVFRTYYDMKGNRKNAWNYFKDNIYLVGSDQIFAFNKGEKWEAPYPYCFIKPIEKNNDKLILQNGIEEQNIGVVHYVHNHAPVSVGDTIYFRKDMEYEFNIDGVKLYRMKTSDLCLKV